MRICLFSILSIFITSASQLLAQELPSSTSKKIKLHYFAIQSQVVAPNNRIGSIEDFRKLAPQSSLLKNTPTLNSPYTIYSEGGDMALSLMLGLKLNSTKPKSYKSIRVGLNYAKSNMLSGYFNYETRKSLDTLVSTTTGVKGYIDSVSRTYVTSIYRTDQLKLDATYIYGTNPEARWSFYSGIGVTVGVSINSSTEIRSTKSLYTELRYGSGRSSSFSEYSSITERNENKSNMVFSAYCPIGINFRVGNKKEFWKHMNLFYETRLDLSINSIPELGSIKDAHAIHGLGLKFTLD